MPKKFNRKYRPYTPAGSGPPTERICKQVKCEDGSSTTPPPSPPSPPYP